MKNYVFKMEGFEGPLDLLLFLIKKNEVNIYDIPIAKITEEYLIALETMKEMNLEIAGEFIVMASTLIFIKSRMLLPVYRNEEDPEDKGEQEDPREELVKLLLEYQKFQEMGKELGNRSILGRDTHKHPKRKVEKQKQPVESLGLFQLMSAYQRIIEKHKEEIKTHQVAEVGKSIQQKINELIFKYPDGFLNLALDELIETPVTRGEIVVSFMAILELTRLGFFKIVQINNEGDILLTTLKPLSMMDTSMISKNELVLEAR